MQPLRSRSRRKLDSCSQKIQAVSAPAPLRNNIKTCKPRIQIQPHRIAAENHRYFCKRTTVSL